MPISTIFCFLLMVEGPLGAPQASGTVMGTLTIEGKATELRYAYAYEGRNQEDLTKHEVRLVLSDVALSEEELQDLDGLSRKASEGKLHAVEARFLLDGKHEGSLLYHEAFRKGYFILLDVDTFESKVFDEKTVAGKLWIEKSEDLSGVAAQYSATFSAPVRHEPKPTAEGPAAAASGPGKVVLEYFRAAQAEDPVALKRVCSEEMMREYEGTEGELRMHMMFFDYRPGTEVQLRSVRETGDRAAVEVRKKSNFGSSIFEIKTVRVSGVWKVTK